MTIQQKSQSCRSDYLQPGNMLAVIIFTLVILSCLPKPAIASDDTHYTSAGFFDVHVCNWPDRPLFLLTLFSSTDFNNIEDIEVFAPSNKSMGHFDLTKYRLVYNDKKQEKRVFMVQLDVPENNSVGWYSAKVKLKNGNSVIAKDYVLINRLDIASITSPDISSPLNEIPKSVRWSKITGAQYYQVFIRDAWESKLIYQSPLLNTNEVMVPGGLLSPGGLYTVQIHARDTNEHILLGDFNHGSLSKRYEFMLAD